MSKIRLPVSICSKYSDTTGGMDEDEVRFLFLFFYLLNTVPVTQEFYSSLYTPKENKNPWTCVPRTNKKVQSNLVDNMKSQQKISDQKINIFGSELQEEESHK